MPTIIRKDGFQVVIWTNDHEPMHVHVFKAEGELVVNLGDSESPVSVRDNYEMSGKNERKALNIVSENQTFLRSKWVEIYGKSKTR